MVHEVSLQVEPRRETGKGPGRRLRARGRIPAVVYGLGKPCRNLSVDARELEHLIAEFGQNTMISLKTGDEDTVEHSIIREYQRDPVTDRLVHADFYRIDPNKPITIEIPVRPVGTPLGVKEGGVLEELMREISVRCLPGKMPSHVEVDVSGLSIGHSLAVGTIAPPEGVEILTPPDTALFTVIAPRKAEEVAAAVEVEEEEAEPEVLREKAEKEEAKEPEEKKG